VAGKPAKSLTRESELKAAIIDADLPPRDLKVFMVLMKRATWVTAKIRDEFQPRSLEELARWAHMSTANVKRSLSHLQRHGWVERYRHVTDKGIGGRGHPTHYQLGRGHDCDCRARKGAQPEPVLAEKGAQDCTIKGLKAKDVSTGQSQVSAKSVSEEGESKRVPLCGVCSQPLDAYLALKYGDTKHIACDPAPGFGWPVGSYGWEANQ
jgi:hypothetical protein